MFVNVHCTSRLVVITTCIIVVGTINIVLLFNSRHGKRSIEHYPDHTQIKSSQRETKKSVNYLEELKHAIDNTYQGFEKKRNVYIGLKEAKVSHENRNNPLTTHSFPLPDCGKGPFLLIQVHSSPSNFLKREAIRLSWGSPQNSINKATAETLLPRLWRTVFLVGQTGNSWLDTLLYEEAKSYGDLLHGDFLDSYRNLSRKMALGIEWAAKHCHDVQFVMKTDDDSYIDILELIKWLERFITRHEDGPLYAGAVLDGNQASRDLFSPYYVSEEEYPDSTYPPYASGAGYVFSGYLLPKLSTALKEVKLFPNEDACFGVLMRHIKVAPKNIERFAPFTMQLAAYRSSDGHSLCQFNGPFLIHRVSGLFQIQTHFNVQIMKHAHTICDHIANGIGEVNIEYFINDKDL